jgi:hypothetical protein
MAEKLFFNKFFANPFFKTFASDESDLDTLVQTDAIEMLGQEVRYDIYQPIRLLLQGDRGIGKTMAILYAKRIINEKKDLKIVIEDTTGLDTSFSSLPRFLQKINEKVYGRINIEKVIKMQIKGTTFYEIAKEIDNSLGDMRVVVLLDVPDVESIHRHLNNLMETLQWIIYIQKFAIILALNYDQIKKFERHGTLLNKFTEVSMRKFTLEMTKQLIELRLKRFSEAKNNGLAPFAEETIELIHDITTGIPRAIIKSCSRLFVHASTNNIQLITKKTALPILNEHYAEDLISMNEADITLRNQYLEIYKILKENGGKIDEKLMLIEKIRERIGGSYISIRERLKKLEAWGVISTARDKDNMIAKQVYLRAG